MIERAQLREPTGASHVRLSVRSLLGGLVRAGQRKSFSRRSFAALVLLAGLQASACGGKTLYQIAETRADERRAQLDDEAQGGDWFAELDANERAVASGRALGHHVLVQGRPDTLLLSQQASRPELIDGEPGITYPSRMRQRQRVFVVLNCVVETTGLVADCVHVAGPDDLAAHVRRTVAQWSYLPAIGYDGLPHAGSFQFVLPFLPF